MRFTKSVVAPSVIAVVMVLLPAGASELTQRPNSNFRLEQ